jgi:phosphomannomutase / phosphoglucomutase
MENKPAPKINPYIFRMYDIRGVVGRDITPEVAALIGRGFGTFCQTPPKAKAIFAVGRDNRFSSKDLHAAICDGLNNSGCDVLDLGLTPTPLVNWAICHWNLDGGINVTGSHNPLDQNGFKLAGKDAYPIAEDDIQQIRKIIEGQAFIAGNGTVSSRDPKEEYLSDIRSKVTLKRPLKIVIDAGNGVAGLFAPEALGQLGCHVFKLYCDLDCTFPHHLPNPENPSNLIDLQRKVLETKADIGFAYDGDGDRIGVINEIGQRLTSDEILILLSRDLLTRHPGSKILVDVKSSQNVIEDIVRHGGIPLIWKTGHSLIKRKMRESGILLAGEFSGHMFAAEDYYIIDDALMASCRLLQIISRQNLPVSKLLLNLPKRFATGLIEAACADSEKFDVVARVTEFFSKQYEVLTIDGARINFGQGWAVVRASNTTATLTLRFEADSERRLDEIGAIVYDKLKEFSSVKLPAWPGAQG